MEEDHQARGLEKPPHCAKAHRQIVLPKQQWKGQLLFVQLLFSSPNKKTSKHEAM